MNRLSGNDKELEENFEVQDSTPAEYQSAGIYGAEISCKHVEKDGNRCTAKWLVPLDENGAIEKADRNAILSHHAEHKRKGFRMKRLRR